MRPYIKLLRPHQWIKNTFVLIPAFFAGKISLVFTDWRLVAGFTSFCIVASSVYILNDLIDLEADRVHKFKSQRPLAAGLVTIRNAVLLLAILIIVGVTLSILIGHYFFYAIVIYVGINILYSLWLKHISLIDISVVATGFVVRVLAGGFIAQVAVSKWLILMTFLLASSLALGKRRDDLLLNVETKLLRPALDGYTLKFIDTCLVVLTVTTLVCYIMYTVSEEVVQRMHSDHIYLTTIFVTIGLLRYLQIAIVDQKSGSPTLILLKDWMVGFMVILWLVAFMLIIYVS